MKNLFFFIILTSFQCCHDQVPDDLNKPPELQPLTMEGKNTLGCKINGQNWVAYVGFNLNGDYAFKMAYDSATGHFGINALWKKLDKSKFQSLGFESYLTNQVILENTC